jgi:amino acid adenylation domain-containing protein
MSTVDGPVRELPRVGWGELFTRQAAASPGRTALVAGGTAWTFRELDLWSNRLANALRAGGARPGTVVACALTRSVRAVLALLAVAKTGAAHLPVDPAQPKARVAAILADARPVVVLSETADLDGWPADLATCSGDPLPPVPGTGAAYVIYTSGSTGTPKGVVVGHQSLVNLYHELEARFFPASPRRVAHGLPLSFDASFDPLLWLVGGHEVHLASEDVRTDPEHYVRFIREHGITVVEAVPAHMTALVEAGLLDTGPDLLLMGGEAVGSSLWSRLRASGVPAVNLYGPTECTVFTTACRLSTSDTPAIGRPIGNTRVEVVDGSSRPVPVGEPGELLVSGACLAREYLGRPDLTADRFVTTRGRAYRTGDRCRLRPDGQLEWLGRLDEQVKIRGHRVEPGEVEHVLRALPEVRQAVVRVEGAGDARRLVAHVVLDAGTGDEVAERLRQVLPDYLVPAAVVVLDALPLGPHGKVDRAAVSRLSPAQELVAAHLRALLGNTVVHAHSDFFTLGGNSLVAAALAARLRALGVSCTLRDVLRLRTVARLAELVPAEGQASCTTTT